MSEQSYTFTFNREQGILLMGILVWQTGTVAHEEGEQAAQPYNELTAHLIEQFREQQAGELMLGAIDAMKDKTATE